MNNNNYSQIPPPPQNQGYQPPMMVAPQTAQIGLPKNANSATAPTTIQCPQCNQVGVTNVRSKMGKGTWCCVALLCFATAILWVIPFCSENCQDKIHTCPTCQAEVGRHEYKVC
ncbi:hypothetical protein ABPG74_018614 [Tetrahymena malaccensis]